MYIRKRGKTWEYRVETPKTQDGKRRPITKGGFKTKKEAEIEGAAIELELYKTGKIFKPSEILLKDCAEEFFEFYTLDELNKIFEYFKIKEIFNCLKVLLLTGLRISELRGLLWKNVDFKNNIITIETNLVSIKDKDIFGIAKTTESVRSFKMSEKLREILLFIKEIQEQNKLKYDEYYFNM